MDRDHTRFLERLRELQGDLKDAEFARRVGIPVTTIKQWLKGSWPSIAAALKIASTYHVSVDWLCGRPGATRDNSVSFNEEGLRQAIEIMESWLLAEEREMSPDKKAELVTRLYEFIADDIAEGRIEVDPSRIRKMLRLVA